MGTGDFHEVLEHAAHQSPGVFHADHHAGEQALKHARRCKVIGGADLFEVNGHGRGRLGAIDHITTAQPLGVAEDVLANPSRGQIGEHLFVGAEVVKVGTGLGTVDQAVVGVHHALGVARGA